MRYSPSLDHKGSEPALLPGTKSKNVFDKLEKRLGTGAIPVGSARVVVDVVGPV